MGAAPIAADASAAPDHSPAFRFRRFLNWFPLGLTYAFLYMGRYNLNVAKTSLGALMTEEDFGIIFAAGTVVYGFAFLLNGPVTDKIGGKKAMIISAVGAAIANLAMGWYILEPTARTNTDLRLWFTVLYSVNMYFQSFGAVAIVKVNAHWFHVRERGSFSGIFGTMISSGIFMAFTVNALILSMAASFAGTNELAQSKIVFFAPAALLIVITVVELFLLKDRPGQAGHEDFDTGDASSGEAADVSLKTVMWKIFTNPIILTVALIEFCTGVIRQGVMQWYPFYAKNVLALPSGHFVRVGSWPEALKPELGLGSIGGMDLDALPVLLAIFAVAVVFFVLAKKAVTNKRKGWLYTSGALVFLAPFMFGGWGGLLFVAGVIGGNVAGHVSDLFFQSRRAPAAGGLYGVLFVCSVLMAFTMGKTTTQLDQVNVPGLQPGDTIVSVAGQGNLTDWPSVAKAFRAIPPQECLMGARWDSAKKMCSANPTTDAADTMPATTGIIPVEIERNGQKLSVELQDWAVKQRAGEPRVMRATPVATLPPALLAAIVFIMSLAVIGTHGLLSGTATMDFGGRKGAATAVGMIDGFVYLGTAVQSVSLGYLTSRNWAYWPWFMVPFALIGFLLCLRIWNAKPKARGTPSPAAMPAAAAAAKTGT